MKLYYDPISTTSRVVMLFLNEHDLPVEREVVNLMLGEHYDAAYVALNPNTAVPTLQDGDLVIGECSAIIKYLADVADSPAYPKELKARARVNAAMDWFNTYYSTDFNKGFVYPQIFPMYRHPDDAVHQATLERGLAFGERRLAVLDQHMLAKTPFVCSETVTLADYIGAVYVGLSAAIDYDLSRFPNVHAWMARMQARPSWRDAHAAFYGLMASHRGGQQRAAG